MIRGILQPQHNTRAGGVAHPAGAGGARGDPSRQRQGEAARAHLHRQRAVPVSGRAHHDLVDRAGSRQVADLRDLPDEGPDRLQPAAVADRFHQLPLRHPAFRRQPGPRHLYNDVDQIYLSDPAELFDRDIGGHGFMSIANGPQAKIPVDTSVMLIDCARMAPLWTIEGAQRGRKNAPDQAGPRGLGPVGSDRAGVEFPRQRVCRRSGPRCCTTPPSICSPGGHSRASSSTRPIRSAMSGWAERSADVAGYRPLTAVEAERPLQRPADRAACGRGGAGARYGRRLIPSCWMNSRC